MEVAIGYYLNLYDSNGADVFLILNEPNSEPTAEDLEQLAWIMEREINSTPDADKKDTMLLLKRAVDLSDCECTKFGFQIVIHKWPLQDVRLEEHDAKIKLDENSIYLLCNSLNAYSGAARHRNETRAADMLLRAQGTISRLFEENKNLREKLESKELQDS